MNPYGEQPISFYLIAYEDYIKTHHSFDSQTTISQMINKLTKDAQKWSDTLHISGEKLSNNI